MSMLRNVQLALGAAGAVTGFTLTRNLVAAAFRDDLLEYPTRNVERNDKGTIWQPRTAQGPGLTTRLMGAGAVVSGGGGWLALNRPAAATGVTEFARKLGGSFAIGMGVGGVAGAAASFANYSNSDYRPN